MFNYTYVQEIIEKRNLKKKSDYPNFRLSEWDPVPIGSDNWSSTVAASIRSFHIRTFDFSHFYRAHRSSE